MPPSLPGALGGAVFTAESASSRGHVWVWTPSAIFGDVSTRKKRQRPLSRSSRTVKTISSIQLVNGWPAPSGARIRLVRPGESREFRRLLAAVDDVEIELDFLDAIESGAIGRTVLERLRTGRDEDMRREVRSRFTIGEPKAALAGLASALAVEAQDGRLVGALLANPPGALVGLAMETGRPLADVVKIMVQMTKIKALAVEEEPRGQGLGSAMLECVDGIYRQLGVRLLYGQFRDESGLEDFYRDRRFMVMSRNEDLMLDDRIGIPMSIQPVGSERIFARWLDEQG
jgi:GNAT superfamily N-acetyltransferase